MFLPQHKKEDFPIVEACDGRCVLITGAGGSIGSALAKALTRAGVERLLLLDASEGNLFELERQLAENRVAPELEFVLGSVEDTDLLDGLLSRQRVDAIYHASAWKHLPLLETQPFAALRNNALGTYALARAALRGGVSRLLLVSTDKAVNPRSIMGASKRLAELVVVSLSRAGCHMNALRLCNVIGASGSVVTIFERQLAQGTRLTVTDPRASRWFLPVDEAVQAILRAGASKESGKIFLPRLGEPVRIAELARFLLASAGKATSDEIRYIGLRPGEKLCEEWRFASEREAGKENGLTMLEAPRLGESELDRLCGELQQRIARRDLAGALEALHSVVPEYEPSEEIIRQVDRLTVAS